VASFAKQREDTALAVPKAAHLFVIPSRSQPSLQGQSARGICLLDSEGHAFSRRQNIATREGTALPVPEALFFVIPSRSEQVCDATAGEESAVRC
jgi:hypothetical protein